MSEKTYSVICGTGKYIPTKIISNEAFLNNHFTDASGKAFSEPNVEIIEKFEQITTIRQRRYADDNMTTSDLGWLAAEDALKSSGVERENLDYIIFAHNFGELRNGNMGVDILPSLAARVKKKLNIVNPNTIAYDLPFGCPGWLQAMIQADYYVKSGDAHNVLVIGADILSRISDPHDRDSMIYADGAGATLLASQKSNTPIGILAHKTRSDTLEHSEMLFMGNSYLPENGTKESIYLKMYGKKLYQYALNYVPGAIQACLHKSGVSLSEIKKVLIHQANGKMDDAILNRLYKLEGNLSVPIDVMPMTISWLGNSSVATVPTLLDLILKKELDAHQIEKGDKIIFASVGAGMNINAMVYQA
ncbi:MAG: 3-oxoacyl-ACP synthase [Flammeovirgaceae bacterium]|nr:3-oxoacyl-ACP synthase [Flammeovirgaceae bacterium]|tara:strand:- start:9627 stop:10709 length:1083 start_codon:yes stop_codon:yes gene_type:complete